MQTASSNTSTRVQETVKIYDIIFRSKFEVRHELGSHTVWKSRDQDQTWIVLCTECQVLVWSVVVLQVWQPSTYNVQELSAQSMAYYQRLLGNFITTATYLA